MKRLTKIHFYKLIYYTLYVISMIAMVGALILAVLSLKSDIASHTHGLGWMIFNFVIAVASAMCLVLGIYVLVGLIKGELKK